MRVGYLRKKKEQLRTMKEHLRTTKELLRTMNEQLRKSDALKKRLSALEDDSKLRYNPGNDIDSRDRLWYVTRVVDSSIYFVRLLCPYRQEGHHCFMRLEDVPR